MEKGEKSFANFWHYNKGKIFSLTALILLVIFSVTQCSFGETSELSVLYVSPYENIDTTAFNEHMREVIGVGDDEDARVSKVRITSAVIPSDVRAPIASGTLDLIHTEIISGASTLYILDEETVYSYESDDMFGDITSYADLYNIPESDRYLSSDGKVIAIDVSSNSCLKGNGIKSDLLYIAVGAIPPQKESTYEKTFAALEHILSHNSDKAE